MKITSLVNMIDAELDKGAAVQLTNKQVKELLTIMDTFDVLDGRLTGEPTKIATKKFSTFKETLVYVLKRLDERLNENYFEELSPAGIQLLVVAMNSLDGLIKEMTKKELRR